MAGCEAFKQLIVILSVVSLANGFCWRKAYGRGVGTFPTACGSDFDYDAGLCYYPCIYGYKPLGPVCWKWCPDGWTDHGIGCTKPAGYWRDAYVWKFGDDLNDAGMFQRCREDHGYNNCEKYGLIVYAKCKSAYWAVGCCYCSRLCPDSFTDYGISCVKSKYGRGVGWIPTACVGGKEYNLGLCYPPCEENYRGIGPVCWSKCPQKQVDCLAGCAPTLLECTSTYSDQVLSMIDAVTSIFESVGTASIRGAAKISIKKAAQAAFKEFASGLTVDSFKERAMEMAKDAGITIRDTSFDVLTNMLSGSDFDISDYDPTGLLQLIKAYNFNICL